MKPLGKKAYGSIPHLLGSKLGEGDHHVHEGQHKICTERTRDKHDFVIVQEKYDGSNVAVCKIDGEIIALTRRGYIAESSPFAQHHYFAKWVEANKNRFDSMLKNGDRICGEWLLQAHGLRYRIPDEPFVAFDYFEGENRLNYEDFCLKVERESDFTTPQIIAFGHGAVAIDFCIERMANPVAKWIVSEGLPEGLIYRVERKGKLDFIAKYVRHDFEPGVLLPEFNGTGVEIWNFDLQKIFDKRN